MNEKKRKIKYKGELDLAGHKLYCCVLEDGERGFSIRSTQEVLGIVDKNSRGKWSANRLGEFLSQKSLQPFFYQGKKVGNFDPIVCYDENDVETHICKAITLIDIADRLLEARKSGKFGKRKDIVSSQAELIVRSVAKVGIIALVDEATGYQYEREEFALQKILNLLVLKGRLFSKWKEMFSLGYYKDLFGVYDVDFTAENISRKPPFIGYLTNELVYKNLPEGSVVLKKIKERTPKTKGGYYKKRFHQSLTPLGKKVAGEIINTVRTLAWVSGKDRNKFRRLVKERLKLERDLPYVDIEAMDDNKKEAKVDKVLGALLKTPKPKKKDDEE